eukprot:TRINITY_DN2770_c0_g1_i1.p1 TRINITY_DN2770_c0_g1~~TRINITY_DN2770_c0_g1_i1.p1  ORF type:complete len:144 (-),score=33.60 TRINITY_DN2770_c0_g1_i1:219-629(-)
MVPKPPAKPVAKAAGSTSPKPAAKPAAAKAGAAAAGLGDPKAAVTVYKDPKAMVIDLRPADIANGTGGALKKAMNIQPGNIEGTLTDTDCSKDTPLLLYCGDGKTAETVKKQLQGLGYTNVTNGGAYSKLKLLIRD